MKFLHRKFNVIFKSIKILGLLFCSGFLIYKGETYNQTHGSIVGLLMCTFLALSLALTGLTIALEKKPG
jgi:hypothetical protein